MEDLLMLVISISCAGGFVLGIGEILPNDHGNEYE